MKGEGCGAEGYPDVLLKLTVKELKYEMKVAGGLIGKGKGKGQGEGTSCKSGRSLGEFRRGERAEVRDGRRER